MTLLTPSNSTDGLLRRKAGPKPNALMPHDQPDRYNFSFIGVSLRPELARIVAEHYLAAGDWEEAKKRILSSNALQSRTTAAAVRLERELRQRLRTLTDDQLSWLAQATTDDGVAMTWLAACKSSPFIFDFAVEVLREKIATHDTVLRYSDYESYIGGKVGMHPELGLLSDGSMVKVKQILLRMLAEASMLGAGAALGVLRRPVLSPTVVRLIVADNPRWLAAFLVPDVEIGRM